MEIPSGAHPDKGARISRKRFSRQMIPSSMPVISSYFQILPKASRLPGAGLFREVYPENSTDKHRLPFNTIPWESIPSHLRFPIPWDKIPAPGITILKWGTQVQVKSQISL